MNYEELYRNLAAQEKDLKDRLAALQRLLKAIGSKTESGDVKNLAKDAEALTEGISELSGQADALKEQIASFDTAAYFADGEFTAQLLAACQEARLDVRGEFPVYEMFPYRVRVDAENQDIYLDRKKIQCMRPKSFAALVKKGQERLNKAAFNPQTFAGELAEAYDLALLKAGRQPGCDIYLLNLYKLLAPMARSRKEYDQQSFAFDLARLYGSGETQTKNGRAFQFGPSRKNNKSIRILDKNGQEQFLSTICFYGKDTHIGLEH